MPGEGKDRVFRVTIKWLAQVSLFALEEALEGRTRQIPFDAIIVRIAVENWFLTLSDFFQFSNHNRTFLIRLWML